MEGDGYCGSFFQRCKPYIAMVSLQFGFAGMNIITKVSLNRGMSHYVLVVYRHAFATAAIAPFAIVLERYLPVIHIGKKNGRRKVKTIVSLFWIIFWLTFSSSVCHWQESEAQDDISHVHANICVGSTWVSNFLALESVHYDRCNLKTCSKICSFLLFSVLFL